MKLAATRGANQAGSSQAGWRQRAGPGTSLSDLRLRREFEVWHPLNNILPHLLLPPAVKPGRWRVRGGLMHMPTTRIASRSSARYVGSLLRSMSFFTCLIRLRSRISSCPSIIACRQRRLSAAPAFGEISRMSWACRKADAKGSGTRSGTWQTGFLGHESARELISVR